MISAIILAAGESKRMGQPKMLLPWRDGTVLSHVISVFQNAGLGDICVITGSERERIESIAVGLRARCVYNAEYANKEMLSSIQCGVRSMPDQTEAVLIGLGDQPQVQEGNVRRVCDAFTESASSIVVPSYQMRRGHPWLIARPLWNEFLKLQHPQTPRDFLKQCNDQINYVDVNDPNILSDLDTPEDYQKWISGKL
jgi:molybdenum cofactor cytidylyltransferase